MCLVVVCSVSDSCHSTEFYHVGRWCCVIKPLAATLHPILEYQFEYLLLYFLIQLPASMLWKSEEDGSKTWALAMHVGDQDSSMWESGWF